MAKNSAEIRKVYTFARFLDVDYQTKSDVSSSTKAKPLVKGMEPRCGEKRKLEVQHGEQGKSMKEKKQRIEIDRFKKLQCSLVLKRLMVHPDGFAFEKPVDPGRPIDLEMIKYKLARGLYLGTDQFAEMLGFSSLMLFCIILPRMKFTTWQRNSEVFEVKWKSLNERWETEKAEVDQSAMTKESEPSTKLKQDSIDENVYPNFLHQAMSMESTSSKKELQKPKQRHFLDTIWLRKRDC